MFEWVSLWEYVFETAKHFETLKNQITLRWGVFREAVKWMS